jgi:hypothetical protein
MATNEDNDFDIPRRPAPAKRTTITAAQLLDESPRNAKITKWRNPTGEPVRIEIFLSIARWAQITIPPGAEVEIPSAYDRAIHQVDAHGVVVGGLAPQLRRVGADGRLSGAVHPGLRDSTSEAK